MRALGRVVRAAVGPALVAGVVVGLTVPALAVPTDATLDADPPRVVYGATTRLFGQVTGAAAGDPVEIRDAATNDLLDDTTTDATGSYEIPAFAPERTVEVKAVAGAVESPPVTIRVKPAVKARIGRVFLFGKTKVTGRVDPSPSGETATLRLLRGTKIVASRSVPVRSDGSVGTRFKVSKLGRYRGQIVYKPAGLVQGADKSRARRPRTPKLSDGAQGKAVRLLERRLRLLHYYLVGINRKFDERTGDAVLAFHKVQGMTRTKTVTKSTWRRLTHPRRPGPRSRRPRFHIEIDQTKQVLYVIRKGSITEIVHTSTGRSGATRDGVFRVHRKVAGYSPNRLYYPSYFDGNRAVHGWPDVPPYPASHGCSRVPYWTAIHLHDIMPIGTVVRVTPRRLAVTFTPDPALRERFDDPAEVYQRVCRDFPNGLEMAAESTWP